VEARGAQPKRRQGDSPAADGEMHVKFEDHGSPDGALSSTGGDHEAKRAWIT
jgi:hypothetical protein